MYSDILNSDKDLDSYNKLAQSLAQIDDLKIKN